MPLADNNKPLPDREATSAKEALEKVQQMIAQAKDKQKLIEVLTGISAKPERPTTARAMSRYSYYKERFALEFKAVLDEMMTEHAAGHLEDRMYNYSDFTDLNPTSLYLKITQSRMYLLDRMDADKKYAKFCEMLSLERETGIGIRLFYHRDVIKGSSCKPSKVVTKLEAYEWKDKVENFLENAVPGEELSLDKLSLSNEQIKELEVSFMTCDNIIHKITNKTIFLARI